MKVGYQSLFAIISSLIVLAAVVAGVIVVGPPGRARDRAVDLQRVQALQNLSNALDGFWSAHSMLPDTLAHLAQDQNGLTAEALRDPETATSYEYSAKGGASYELCARFAAKSDVGDPLHWRHGAGRTCFPLTATGAPRS